MMLTCSNFLLGLHPLAVQAHINLETTLSTLSLHFRHHFLEWFEVLTHCLVYQDISVGQIEDALHESRGMQPVDNLERSIGLSCTSSHHQQDSFLPASNSLDGVVDGYALIIARRETVTIGIIRNLKEFLPFFGQVLMLMKPSIIAFFQS